MSLLDESQVRIILLDIEGTTTPVEFVYQTLFPYASRKLDSFVRQHFQNPEIQATLQDLRIQHERDEREAHQPPAVTGNPGEASLPSIVAYGQWLIARDSKCTALKSLQGKIWQEGFASGELRGQVFADVPPAFARWRRQKREIQIYSSGSVLAQQLLFRTVATGDLTPYISAFYDTSVGTKTQRGSYERIAASVKAEPAEFLFISDAAKEVDAARSAGMQALLCERGGNSPSVAHREGVIHTFDEVSPAN